MKKTRIGIIGTGAIGKFHLDAYRRAASDVAEVVAVCDIDEPKAKRFAEEAAFLIPRTDIDLDESAISPLFAKNVELGGTSEGIGVDVFDFDPLASMQDRTRNSISSMFTGEKPDSVAKEIQSEIDK